MDRVVLEISWASIWRVLLLVFLGFVFYLARDVLIALMLVLVISAGLAPAVNFLESKRIPRVLATSGLFIVILLSLGLLVYAIVPVLLQESGNLITKLSAATHYQDTVFNFKGSTQAINTLVDWINTAQNKLFAGNVSLGDLAKNIVGGLTLAFSVVILSFYLTASRGGVERFLRALLPEKSEEYVISLVRRATHKIGIWFQSQLLLSAMIGISLFIGLVLFGIQYSVLLSVFAAVLEVVPFVGSIVAGGLAVAIAYSKAPTLGLYILLYIIAIQQIESHFVIPILFHRRVGLHPVIVISSLLIGAEVAGFVGAVLAIPVAVVVQEILEDWGARKGKNQNLNL